MIFPPHRALGAEQPVFQFHRIEPQYSTNAKDRQLRLLDQAVHRDRMYLEALGHLREGENFFGNYGLVLLANHLYSKSLLTAQRV